MLENVRGGYSSAPVLAGVSMEVTHGECVGLIGRNGAGKTTLIRAILRQLPRVSGAVHFGDTDLTRLTTRQVVNLGVAYVPQGRAAFSELTVRENLSLVPVQATDAERIDILRIDYPVLLERLNQLAGTLSGGECQQLSLARASLYDARLLLLDEPTANLSAVGMMSVIRAIARWRAKGLTMLIIEHNLDFLLDVCDRLVGIERGTVQLNVRTSDLKGAGDPKLSAFFGLGSNPSERNEQTPAKE